MLKILPEISREECFALHGGTAINLFIRNMPRLSVDIDLTYIPIEDRDTSLRHIGDALSRIRKSVIKTIPDIHIEVLDEISKLTVSSQMAQIKLEVNQTGRGVISPPKELVLCPRAQEEFEVFCAIPVVPAGQLLEVKYVQL